MLSKPSELMFISN